MVMIEISPALSEDRKKERFKVSGETVGEVLDRHAEIHGPGLREKVLDEDDSINLYINIYLNGREVSTLEGLPTTVTDDDELRIIPAISGGCR